MPQIKCKHCGQLIDDSAIFCPKCGEQIEKTASQAPPQTPPSPQTPPPFGQSQKNNESRQNSYTATPNGMKVRNIEMIEACKMYWQKYAEFEGRSRRAEYWWAQLMLFIIGCALSPLGFSGSLASLVTLVPSLAIGARRLHDINKSGWFQLLHLIPIAGSIILIVWYCQEGDIGRNQYGEDPKYIQ